MRKWAEYLSEKWDDDDGRQEIIAIASAFVETLIIILLLALIYSKSCYICYVTGQGYEQCASVPEMMDEGMPSALQDIHKGEKSEVVNQSVISNVSGG